MAERIVLLRMGGYGLSLPFHQVDEILGADRARARDSLPEDLVPGEGPETSWVSSRGRWLPVRELLPEIGRARNSQIIVVTCQGSTSAFMVDQVAGIENAAPAAPFPEAARRFTDIPFSGVRFLEGRPVLELDLSRLISLDTGGGPGG